MVIFNSYVKLPEGRVYEEYTVTITDFPTRAPILDSHRLIMNNWTTLFMFTAVISPQSHDVVYIRELPRQFSPVDIVNILPGAPNTLFWKAFRPRFSPAPNFPSNGVHGPAPLHHSVLPPPPVVKLDKEKAKWWRKKTQA